MQIYSMDKIKILLKKINCPKNVDLSPRLNLDSLRKNLDFVFLIFKYFK
jgi:hypothetical protein